MQMELPWAITKCSLGTGSRTLFANEHSSCLENLIYDATVENILCLICWGYGNFIIIGSESESAYYADKSNYWWYFLAVFFIRFYLPIFRL